MLFQSTPHRCRSFGRKLFSCALRLLQYPGEAVALQRLSLGTPGGAGPGQSVIIRSKLFWFLVLFIQFGGLNAELSFNSQVNIALMNPPKPHISRRQENWRSILFYDDCQREFPVPTEPWAIKDDPETGKIHLVIYVGGEAHGAIKEPTTGRWLDPKRVPHIYLNQSKYKMRDPQDKERKRKPTVGTELLDGSQDGFNQMMRYQWLHPETQEAQEGLRQVLKEVCRMIKDGIRKSKTEKKVRVDKKNGDFSWVYVHAIAILCTQV